MIFVYGLMIYSLVTLVKFFVLATITDLKSHLTGNWKSEERDHAVNHELWMAGKSIAAFFAAGFLMSALH